MRRSLITLIIIVLIALAATNPSKADFVYWGQQKMIEEMNLQTGLVKLGASFLNKVYLENRTKTTDFVFFSIYEIPFSGNRATVIGAFNRFIVWDYAPVNPVTLESAP